VPAKTIAFFMEGCSGKSKRMKVEALMNLRNQVDERLVELWTELEKQLAAITVRWIRRTTKNGPSH
jgi:hypothetical protein